MRRAVLVLCCVVALVVTGGSTGAPLRVGVTCVGSGTPCLRTLARAIAATPAGGTIRIGKGTFAGGVVVGKSLTLVGAGPAVSVIAGGGPVLTVGGAVTVSISGVTIRGGITHTDAAGRCGPDVPSCGPGYTSATALGGGVEIRSANANVTIANSVVTDNRATPSKTVASVSATCPSGPCRAAQGAGGGIDDWGTLHLRRTVVRGNQAGGVGTAQADGGGIAVEAGAHLVVDDSSVADNNALAPEPLGRFASGGGVYVDDGGTLTIRSSHVDRNTVTLASSFPPSVTSDSNASGAGIMVTAHGIVSIDASSLDGNAVHVTDHKGDPVGFDAGICVCDSSSSLSMTRTEIRGNRVTIVVADSPVGGSAGIVEADGNSRLANVRVTGNVIAVTASRGTAASGAVVNIFPDAGEHAVVSTSRIIGNTVTAVSGSGRATVSGAGLATNGVTTLQGVTIAGNVASARAPRGWVKGGGVFNGNFFAANPAPHAVLTLKRSAVIGNATRVGGGVTAQGAGVYTVGFPTHLSATTVSGNHPDQCGGCHS